MTTLETHARVAVIGGGPAGASFALHLLHLAPQVALAQVFDVRLHGFLTRLLRQSAYSALMPGRCAQVRVWTDWILGQLFGRDSTLLRGR